MNRSIWILPGIIGFSIRMRSLTVSCDTVEWHSCKGRIRAIDRTLSFESELVLNKGYSTLQKCSKTSWFPQSYRRFFVPFTWWVQNECYVYKRSNYRAIEHWRKLTSSLDKGYRFCENYPYKKQSGDFIRFTTRSFFFFFSSLTPSIFYIVSKAIDTRLKWLANCIWNIHWAIQNKAKLKSFDGSSKK